MTDLVTCAAGGAEGCERAAAGGRPCQPPSPARRRKGLWGNDKGGRFRTTGATSMATAARHDRGWSKERCEGTLTRHRGRSSWCATSTAGARSRSGPAAATWLATRRAARR